jgi:hypothetical protein
VLKLIRLVVAAVLAVSLAVLAAPFFRADAATKPVTVHKIATKTVASGASATVRPNVSTVGQVKVTSKKLTVKKGSKTVAKNKSSVKLKAGSYAVTSTVKYKTYVVKGGKRKYAKTKTAKLSQTLVIKTVSRPNRTSPVSDYDCPSWAPIKGNAQSMIYPLPRNRYYDVTKPEDCFRTESAARDAGYRAAKV